MGKRYIFITLFFLILLTRASIHKAEVKAERSVGCKGLNFIISLPKKTFQSGDEISLKLVIKNTSGDKIIIPSSYANLEGSRINLRSGMFIICQRNTAEYMPFKGKYFKASEAGYNLKPNDSYVAMQIDLTKCFDIQPGKYDIQLLFATKYSGFVDAASNRLTFEIIKGE